MASTSGQAQPAKKKLMKQNCFLSTAHRHFAFCLQICNAPVPRHKQVMSDFRLLALTKFDVS